MRVIYRMRGKFVSPDFPWVIFAVHEQVAVQVHWLSALFSSVHCFQLSFLVIGLLGDATEEFVETLDAGGGKGVSLALSHLMSSSFSTSAPVSTGFCFVFAEDGTDDEEQYRMASVLCECGGLDAMLTRYSALFIFFLSLLCVISH